MHLLLNRYAVNHPAPSVIVSFLALFFLLRKGSFHGVLTTSKERSDFIFMDFQNSPFSYFVYSQTVKS